MIPETICVDIHRGGQRHQRFSVDQQVWIWSTWTHIKTTSWRETLGGHWHSILKGTRFTAGSLSVMCVALRRHTSGGIDLASPSLCLPLVCS